MSRRCAMGTRFNSFYKADLHPFVDAMVGALAESGARAIRPLIATYLKRSSQRKYDADIAVCHQVANDLVKARKESPTEKNDLLNSMLNEKDPKTGESMTDESIVNNMITFIIAGEHPMLSVT